MSNSLEQIIHSLNSVFNNSYHLVCDENLQFRYVGNKFIEILGMDKSDFIGKNLENISSPIQHLAPEYYKLNSPVLMDNIVANYSTVAYLNSEYFIVTSKTSPIIINGEIKGIVIENHCSKNNTNIVGLNVISSAAKERIAIHNHNKQLSSHHINLGDIEELIMFLLMLGKGDKEISTILTSITQHITTHAISKVITRKLFIKFQVNSRKELINKIFKIGLSTKLPKLLIHNPILLLSI